MANFIVKSESVDNLIFKTELDVGRTKEKRRLTQSNEVATWSKSSQTIPTGNESKMYKTEKAFSLTFKNHLSDKNSKSYPYSGNYYFEGEIFYFFADFCTFKVEYISRLLRSKFLPNLCPAVN